MGRLGADGGSCLGQALASSEYPGSCAAGVRGPAQSGGLRFSQQFSEGGGRGVARTCVTFNMVEAEPIAYHLLRDSQRGRKFGDMLTVLSQLLPDR